MATSISLPALTTFTEEHLSAILKATTQGEFDAAFDAFVSKDATIILNGERISLAEYHKALSGGFDVESVDVRFLGAVEVPTDAESTQAGAVGIFLQALVTLKLREEGGAVQNQVTSSFNVVIAEDPRVGHTVLDKRRAMVVNQVTTTVRKN
ncbi:hypothetical protein GGX14DRAFT_607163 [Mycena pura]|uniref:Uncharacterized protein n=1 Tax=Mycena pura TaxID=153505 RepID=A0AAD6VPY7_9AGAR|nr:hypothetical protein GGX14DRAFT_607163 [Mycena pura]